MDFTYRTLEEKQLNLTAAILGTKQIITLPRDRYVQQIALRVRLKSGIGGAAAKTEGLVNLLSNIMIKSNGSDIHADVSGYDIYAVDKYEYGTAPRNDTMVDATDCFAEVVFNFQTNVKNPNDISAVIPSKSKSSFDLIITLGVLADVWTGGAPTFTSGDITISMREVDLTENDIAKQGAFYSVYYGVIEDNTGTKTFGDYLYSLGTPVGKVIHFLYVHTFVDTVRTNGYLSKYLLKNESKKTDILQSGWYESRAADKLEYSLETILTGITVIDMRDYGLLDARGLKYNDITIRGNIPVAAGANGKVRLVSKEVA
jgi:hypothetical protein